MVYEGLDELIEKLKDQNKRFREGLDFIPGTGPALEIICDEILYLNYRLRLAQYGFENKISENERSLYLHWDREQEYRKAMTRYLATLLKYSTDVGKIQGLTDSAVNQITQIVRDNIPDGDEKAKCLAEFKALLERQEIRTKVEL